MFTDVEHQPIRETLRSLTCRLVYVQQLLAVPLYLRTIHEWL